MRRMGSTYRLSASDLAGFLSCRHLTTLERQTADGNLEKPRWQEPMLEVLRERGDAHEAEYLHYLENDQKLSVLELAKESSAEDAIAAMRSGADVIAQPTLQDELGKWFGRVDVLRRVSKPSALGDWSYEVIDTKLTADTRGETILQLCLYSDLVERIQGLLPEFIHVVSPGKFDTPESFRTDDYFAYYRLVQRKLSDALEPGGMIAKAATYPDPVPHCEICRWFPRCRDERRADDHLSLVAGATRLQQRELVEVGIETMTSLATAALPLSPAPKRGSPESYARAREQARVQHESRELPTPKYELLDGVEPGLGLARLPEPSAADLFFDFEGDPFVEGGGREYLFGWVEHGDNGEPTYEHLWGLDSAAERLAFETFIDRVMARLEEHPDLHIYHFGAYEPSAFKRLMGRYGTRELELDVLLRAERFVDLHAVVKRALRVGVESYSLKDLEPLHAFTRELPLKEVSAQLRGVERALELCQQDAIPRENLDAVVAYNRDDCLSTLGLRDWLEGIRKSAIENGADIPRPTLKEGEPPEQLDAELKRLRELFERLTHNIPVELGERSAEENARFLLAHMLEFHRREDKAVFWEKFRLGALSEDDLLEERSGLSGLVFEERVGGTKRCPIDRYRFPTQECDLSGKDLYRLGPEKHGTVDELSLRGGWIDIKKREDSEDLHPRAVFAHRYIDPGEIPLSLERIARWVADNGIDSEGDFRAARDLVLRCAPRLKSTIPTGESFVRKGEDLGDAANRLVLELENGVLPIQGPPGCGKTHMGAHMICTLIAAGKKVGITAVSHKVIRNLMDKVFEVAPAGLELRALHKVSELSQGALPDGLAETTDNAPPLAALGGGEVQLVGGTAWLWARPEYANAVDVLVVDEAGQMSLANTVAVSQAAESLVLLGDPQQLEQPIQGSHPEGSDVSALQHLLGNRETLPEDRGLFLGETWRLHPDICGFTSELFYESKLTSRDICLGQKLVGNTAFGGTGLWLSLVEHTGNQSSSPEEAERVVELANDLLNGGTTWINPTGEEKTLSWDDIVIVAPYNAQVAAISALLPNEAKVGTVDKFQGQEAPVVIYSTATSSPDDAPRGMEFLYNLNRLNVATSRARCVCILVSSPKVLEPECRTPAQMRLANALCRYSEAAERC